MVTLRTFLCMRGSRFCWLTVLALALASCDPRTIPTDGGIVTGRDAASVDASNPYDGWVPPCAPGCGSNEICIDGTCAALPAHCPCPVGSYCDLATNSCHAGCVTNEECGPGLYCEVDSRTCLPGCRVNEDCAVEDVCDQHACVNHCSCDDADPCTTDSCAHGVCAHVPGNEGAACADDGSVCTSDVCHSGVCTHPAAREGARCDSAACERNTTCQRGACVGTPVGESEECGTGIEGICIGGLYCATPSATCRNTYWGSGWKSGGYDFRFCDSSGCHENDFLPCGCDSDSLSGGGGFVTCSDCQLAGWYHYHGGSGDPGGFSIETYVCLD